MSSGRSKVPKLLAFSLYLEMGEDRSIKGLERRLNAEGHTIARSTLMAWKAEGEWDKKIPEIEAARELEADCAKAAIAAKDVLDAASEAAVQGEIAYAADHLQQVSRADLQATPMVFSLSEKFESASESLFAVVAALSQTATRHIAKIRPEDVTLDVPELLQVVRAVGEAAKAAADMHRAMNPTSPKGAKGAPIDVTPPAPGAALPPGQYVHDDDDDLIEALLNPPRLKQA